MHFRFSDHFINSHNHFFWQHADIVGRKLMLVNIGTERVKIDVTYKSAMD